MKVEVHRKDGEIENRPVSKGGKLFDLITYFGIAGVGTFLATIPTGALFLEGGKFHGAFQKVESGLKHIGFSKRMASHGANTFATFWGGTLMLVPVGLIEHNRAKIVNAFNRYFNDPTDPQSVEEAPPQTANSIVKARVVATGTVFAGFVGAETLVGEQRFKRGLEQAGEKLSEVLKKPTHVLQDGKMVESLAYKFGRTGALDVLATVSSASLLYVGSHFFAKRAYESRVTKDYMRQKREEHAAGTVTRESPTATAEAPTQAADATTPSTTISTAQHAQTLAAAPAQAQLTA